MSQAVVTVVERAPFPENRKATTLGVAAFALSNCQPSQGYSVFLAPSFAPFAAPVVTSFVLS